MEHKKLQMNPTSKQNNFFAALALLLIPVYSSFAQVYPSNDEALYHRALGEVVTQSQLAAQGDLYGPGINFSTWNTWGGSQNKPVIAEAAIGDYQWVAALCRYEKLNGVFGIEFGSPGYYFHQVIAAKLVALRDARAAGAYSDAADIVESLRAVWAYEALTALVTPRKTTWADEAGFPIHNGTGDVSYYNGLTTAVAGERWHSNNYVDHDSHGEYFSWTIDWQPRSASPANVYNGTGQWYNITARVGMQGQYNHTMDPEIFGLNASDRQKLTDVVNGDINAAKWAAQVFANFSVYQNVKIRMRKTTLGSEVVYFVSNNGNKPTHAATQIMNNGDWYTIAPGFESGGTGANGGYNVWIANGKIYAKCDPGAGVLDSLTELCGSIIWQLDIQGSTVQFNGTTISPAGAAVISPPIPDAGVTGIVTTNLLNDTVTPKVTVKNFGTSTINNVYVNYTLNNSLSYITTWVGSLAPGASVNVTLQTAPAPQGQYTLTAFTGGPNYKNDANTNNDASTITFSVAPPGPDAGITLILSPAATITADTLFPRVRLKNFWTGTLTSVNLIYKLDNNTPITTPWTGSVAPAGILGINLPITTPLAPGVHTLKAYTSMPNGVVDSDPTNDMVTMTFTVTSPYRTDVQAVAVAKPYNSGCAVNITPLVVIKNIGPVELTQITINYRVDAGAVISKSYSVAPGNGLAVSKAMGVSGNPTTTTAGVHSLKIWTSNPNAVTDLNNSNDTLVQSFTVSSIGQSLPFTEDFESVVGSSIPVTWTLYNSDANDQWFVYSIGTNKAAAFNNFAYTGARNLSDELLTPLLNLTGGTTHAYLSFDLAHASQPNATVFDSLDVLISTDCGQTFTSVWSRGGTALNTAADNSNIFIPAGPQDYQNIQIDLSAYATFNAVILKFVNWSNNGNSTLVDNVNVSLNQTTGIASTNLSGTLNVFPNPATDAVEVSFQLQKEGQLKMQLLNAMGQIVNVIDNGLQYTGMHTAKIDLSNLPNGVYNLAVFLGEGKIIAKKIIITK